MSSLCNKLFLFIKMKHALGSVFSPNTRIQNFELLASCRGCTLSGPFPSPRRPPWCLILLKARSERVQNRKTHTAERSAWVAAAVVISYYKRVPNIGGFWEQKRCGPSRLRSSVVSLGRHVPAIWWAGWRHSVYYPWSKPWQCFYWLKMDIFLVY